MTLRCFASGCSLADSLIIAGANWTRRANGATGSVWRGAGVRTVHVV